MSDLAFVQNYKDIRKRLNGGVKNPVVVVKPEQSVPTPVEPVATEEPRFYKPPENITRLKILKDRSVRDYVRRVVLLEQNITYRQALLKGAEDVPKRVKLLILPILEEHNYSWEELFGKDKGTSRNSRTAQSVEVKWQIFREIYNNLETNPNQIARWCGMDHTSVLYGLGLLKKRKRANDRDQ